MNTQEFKGIVVAMVTPFTRGGTFVDFDRIPALVNHFVKQGAGGLFVCGTTGEGMLLHLDERKEVLEAVCDAANGRIPVIAHTGNWDTDSTIELTRHAAEYGADAAAVVAPGYYAYDEAALSQHFIRVARAVPDFPILLYNIPSCARNDLRCLDYERLTASAPNIVGMKDSGGDMKFLTRLLGWGGARFQVINGCDEYGFQAFAAGCRAAVSGTANVVLDVYRSVYENMQKGNTKRAWERQVQLERLCRVFEYGRAIARFKEGLRLRYGIDTGAVRPPQRELTRAEKKQLAAQLVQEGLL